MVERRFNSRARSGSGGGDVTGIKLVTIAACAVVATAVMGSPAVAAPIFLQEFQGAALVEPFHLHPGWSGTSQGELTPANTLITDDGANGTTQSSQISFTDDPAITTTPAGHAWQIRHNPNSGANSTAANPLFAADGYVGYWLKVEPTVTATIRTAPVLEPAAGTSEATAGTLQTVIKDGQWHLYQWDMDDPAAFNTQWKTVYDAPASTLGDTDLEATNSFDSIAFVSPDGGDTTIRIDQIGYDNAGPLGPIPEPTSLAFFGLAGMALLRRHRR
jgi:hypothetical protein